MMKHLSIHPHPVCCGIYDIGHFGFSTTNAGSLGPRPLDELEADLLEAEKRVPAGMVLCTLNEEQVPHVEYLLEKHGWSPVVRDFGGNHKFKTTLYCKVLKKTETTKVGALSFIGKDKRINNSTPGKSTAQQQTKPQASPSFKAFYSPFPTARPSRTTSPYRGW